MKLEAIVSFDHAEDMIHVMHRTKGELFEVNDHVHGEKLIKAGFAKEHKPKTRKEKDSE